MCGARRFAALVNDLGIHAARLHNQLHEYATECFVKKDYRLDLFREPVRNPCRNCLQAARGSCVRWPYGSVNGQASARLLGQEGGMCQAAGAAVAAAQGH